MSKIHRLIWKGGEIEIDTLGCKMIPVFNLNGRKIKPLHEPKWLDDNSEDLHSLPGILQNLKGEFPCVPFGINSPIEEITEELPSSLTISIPDGTGVPGCEETNECFLPYEATVSVGSTVTWSNDDSAAHTVTSGNVNAGPTGVFDSGLFMAGSTFTFDFDEAGKYDYFCMVHPWMTGFVDVV